jgi:Thioredoxin domain
MVTIEVLSDNGPTGLKMEQAVRQALLDLEDSEIDAALTQSADHVVWARYGLRNLPGLVIHDRLVCEGRIPKESEIVQWLGSVEVA